MSGVLKLVEGIPLKDIVAGTIESLAIRISSMVQKLNVAKEVVITGGGAKNIGLVKAVSRKLGHSVLVPPEPLLTGAIGAALLGRDIFQKAIKSGLSLERKNRTVIFIK